MGVGSDLKGTFTFLVLAIALSGCAGTPGRSDGQGQPTSATTASAPTSGSEIGDEADYPNEPKQASPRVPTAGSVFGAGNDPLETLDDIRFGLLHGHTYFSDGSGTPTQAFARAKSKGLDFFALTEHNHAQAETGDRADGVLIATTPALYNSTAAVTVTRNLAAGSQTVTVSSLLSATTAATDSSFVALGGQEFSTISSGNHVNVLRWPEVLTVQNGDYRALFEMFAAAVEQGAPSPIVQLNHPDIHQDLFNSSTSQSKRQNDYGYDDYGRSFANLVTAADPFVALIEILSGPALDDAIHPVYSYASGHHERDYLYYLAQGFHVSPSAGQDNHYVTWGDATPARMGVNIADLTPDALYAAIRANRTYATEDSDLQVEFTINDKPMGSVVTASAGASLRIALAVNDPTDPDGTYEVTLLHGAVLPQQHTSLTKLDLRDAELGRYAMETGQAELDEQKATGAPEFFYLRISEDSDGDRAWTAPIWINHPRSRDAN